MYFQRTLKLAMEQGNRWAASEAHRHLTAYTWGEQRFTHALRSLELRQEMGFKRGLPAAQLLLSDISVEQGELAQALEYCQQAEQLAEEMGLSISILDALLIRSDIASRQRKYAEAYEYIERASVLAQQLKSARGITLVNEKREKLAREQES